MLIKVSNISKSYGTHLLFKDVGFRLERGQRLCVVGPNGSGKSTLLKIIAGIEDSDSGTVKLAKNARLAYIPQDTKLLETQQSGGQKILQLLEEVLARDPDILILDEPTNNLDIKNLEWLESTIIAKQITCVIVSHDRVFLDKTTNKILEIDPKTNTVRVSSGSYSEYLARRQKEQESQSEAYKDQQEKVKKIEASVREKIERSEKGKNWKPDDNDKLLKGFKQDRAAGSARAGKALERRLEKMTRIEKPTEQKPLIIEIDGEKTPGNRSIKLLNVVVGYKNGFKLAPVDMEISFGNRIAIIGPNGSGKSTLLKTILGYLKPLRGEVEVGSGVRIGNLMQEHDSMNLGANVMQFTQQETGLAEPEIFKLLAYYGLNASNIRGNCGDLSPGQRARVIFAVMQARNVNTLILDEPTNHLDIDAMNALYELLKNFSGTVVVVTHDRYFLKQLKADYVYEVGDGKVKKIKTFSHNLSS